MLGKKKDKDIVPTTDGITSLTNDLVNQRNATNTNRFKSQRIDKQELREMFRCGVPRKICNLKAGYALKNTLIFESSVDEQYYNKVLSKLVKKAARFQLGFGRGIVVLYNTGDDLSQPLTESFNTKRARFHVFSGDMVTSGNISFDLQSPRYYKPIAYTTRSESIHWTRVVDFTYIEPVENDLSLYQYGGIPEPELIYNQLMNDAIVQRSNTSIIEKVSTIFYKIKDFKKLLQMKQEGKLLSYFSSLENMRSIYGAGIVDFDDAIETVTQQLTGLKEMDDTSLRRLSLVTGIPVPILVGENVKGLNATGENERQVLNDTISNYQSDYLIDPINELMRKLDRGEVKFKDGIGMSPTDQAIFDDKIIKNAMNLQAMGEDFDTYLLDYGITKDSDIENFFSIEKD